MEQKRREAFWSLLQLFCHGRECFVFVKPFFSCSRHAFSSTMWHVLVRVGECIQGGITLARLPHKTKIYKRERERSPKYIYICRGRRLHPPILKHLVTSLFTFFHPRHQRRVLFSLDARSPVRPPSRPAVEAALAATAAAAVIFSFFFARTKSNTHNYYNVIQLEFI